MIYVCYILCFAMAYCLVNIYCKIALKQTAKECLSKGKLFLYVMLLGAFLLWGGDKPEPPEPPTPPDIPDEPDEPYEPVEGVRIRLIGKTIDGKFIPLTSEWIEADGTNIVEIIEQVTEELE